MRTAFLGTALGLVFLLAACGGSDLPDRDGGEPARPDDGDDSGAPSGQLELELKPPAGGIGGPPGEVLHRNDGKDGDGGKNECREAKECTRIEDNQNITHVFLNLKCDAGDFRVTLETDQFGRVDVTDRLHDNGGPCGDIERDFWFVVPGPDEEAKVCVIFEENKRSQVKVSYKAGGECVENEDTLFQGEKCEKCEKRQDGGGGPM